MGNVKSFLSFNIIHICHPDTTFRLYNDKLTQVVVIFTVTGNLQYLTVLVLGKVNMEEGVQMQPHTDKTLQDKAPLDKTPH